MFFNECLDLWLGDWLGEEGVHACPVSLFHESLLCVRCTTDDEGLLEVGILEKLPDARGKFWPIHLRHAIVQHDQAKEGLILHQSQDQAVLDQVESILSVGGRFRLDAN